MITVYKNRLVCLVTRGGGQLLSCARMASITGGRKVYANIEEQGERHILLLNKLIQVIKCIPFFFAKFSLYLNCQPTVTHYSHNEDKYLYMGLGQWYTQKLSAILPFYDYFYA